ncbi:FxSxx-COOH cyclophane-containing RiPP peptide [Streptosporangium sp. KLBMP 9127]|nr:FxSxx-COOH protein [Streptosporangium sp. KLBMP 9127]
MEDERDDLVAELVDLSKLRPGELDALPSEALARALRRLVEVDGNAEPRWVGHQDST